MKRPGRGCHLRAVLAAAMALPLLASCGEAGKRAGADTTEAARRARDSVWAVQVAARVYAKHTPGTPVVLREFRREGSDYVVSFHPGREWLGGGGVIRVKPGGDAVVEDLTQ